jgi:GntR family transcriptional regulator
MSTGVARLLLPSLDRGSPVPLYYQLAQAMQHAIEAGDLAPRVPLGNEVDLAHELGISRPTVRRALGYLVARGLLVRRRGIGTVVVPTSIRRSIGLTSLYDVAAPPDVAATLGLEPGARVIHVRRLRMVDGEPLAIMENHLPAGLVRLDRAELEATGLYRLLRAAGVEARIASQTIGARQATVDEAVLLDIEPGAPVLQLRRVSYDESGRATEYAWHAYAAERHSFEMNLVSDMH